MTKPRLRYLLPLALTATAAQADDRLVLTEISEGPVLARFCAGEPQIQCMYYLSGMVDALGVRCPATVEFMDIVNAVAAKLEQPVPREFESIIIFERTVTKDLGCRIEGRGALHPSDPLAP
jgi:hypothetical protein